MSEIEKKTIKVNHVFQILISMVLILFGLVSLLKEIRLNGDLWIYLIPLITGLFGLYFLVDYLLYKTQKSIISGMMLCIFGFFIFLNNIHVLLFRDYLIPIFFLSLGITLLCYFLASSEKVYLWIGSLLLLLGVFQVMLEENAFDNINIQKYWPLSFIIVGFIILLLNFRKKK